MTLALHSDCEQFFREVECHSTCALLLDYDGTLAPFTVHRDKAYPYPDVPELLDAIHDSGRTRLSVISGRSAREVRLLLNTRAQLEVWGSHGQERLLPDGSYFVADTSGYMEALALADARLQAEGIRQLVEMKTGAVAVHWRGLPDQEASEVRTRAYRVFQHDAALNDFSVVEFDGGVELRCRSANKGNVVRAICAEMPEGAPIAYLGDDTTDEDAFKALRGRGLTVLVRPSFRETAAEMWLQPPFEVVGFLCQWLQACGGGR